MIRPPLAELSARCLKPGSAPSGNWMARCISRPLALRVTWAIYPYSVSAHAVTCLALLAALAAAGCFATGGRLGCVAGVGLLQFWYLLDHVDGQVARLRGQSSLDGVQLDYLMHHVVNLVAPCGLGYGMWRTTGHEPWLGLGFALSLGLLLLGLANDTRYKAFIARLKQLDGELIVVGRRSNEREAMLASDVRRVERLLRGGVHLGRKLCEIHVVMNCLTLTALAQCLAGSDAPLAAYLLIMAPVAVLTSIGTIARDIRRGAAEREFSHWYAPHHERESQRRAA